MVVPLDVVLQDCAGGAARLVPLFGDDVRSEKSEEKEDEEQEEKSYVSRRFHRTRRQAVLARQLRQRLMGGDAEEEEGRVWEMGSSKRKRVVVIQTTANEDN